MNLPKMTEPLAGANPQKTLTTSGGLDRPFLYISWTNFYLQADHSSIKARHYKSTALDWSNDHNKTYRLLEWLDVNHLERDIVFAAPKKGRYSDTFKSRKDCYIEIAQYIFTAEDHPIIHRELSKNATRIATSIGNRLES